MAKLPTKLNDKKTVNTALDILLNNNKNINGENCALIHNVTIVTNLYPTLYLR